MVVKFYAALETFVRTESGFRGTTAKAFSLPETVTNRIRGRRGKGGSSLWLVDTRVAGRGGARQFSVS